MLCLKGGIGCRGVIWVIIYLPVLRSRSTLCFMPDVIMYKRLLQCFLSSAAPGGKSTLARSVLPEGSLLVANEVMRNRVQVLAENVTKWGHPDTVVLNNDPADFAQLGDLFDVILTDVPCSGEGMFRKDPVAVEEWSKENVTLCWQRQRRIVSDE